MLLVFLIRSVPLKLLCYLNYSLFLNDFSSSPKENSTSPRHNSLSYKHNSTSPKGNSLSPKHNSLLPKNNSPSPKGYSLPPKDNSTKNYALSLFPRNFSFAISSRRFLNLLDKALLFPKAPTINSTIFDASL